LFYVFVFVFSKDNLFAKPKVKRLGSTSKQVNVFPLENAVWLKTLTSKPHSTSTHIPILSFLSHLQTATTTTVTVC